MKCYLMYAGTLWPEYEAHKSIGDAKAEFLSAATQLDNFGQHLEASLHIAASEDQINEYPDYTLSLGKRGALKCERT